MGGLLLSPAQFECCLLLEAYHESPALATGSETLLVQICLHSSLEQLRTEPPNAIYFFNVY